VKDKESVLKRSKNISELKNESRLQFTVSNPDVVQ
jgi:hypothetical protein